MVHLAWQWPRRWRAPPACPHGAAAAQRIAEVVLRRVTGAAVAQRAAIQLFTELDSGGVQRVVAKEPADELQGAPRAPALRDVRDGFLLGDVPFPAQLPGTGGVALRRAVFSWAALTSRPG
jgi:hypothetical protein